MKEHSLSFRFIIVVIFTIFVITIFVGGESIYEIDKYIQKETKNLVDVTCENEATKINYTFGGMEKSVNIMGNYVLSFFENAADAKDPAKQSRALQFVDQMFVNVAKDTEGAIAYYLRFNPEISSSTAGIFYSKVDGGDEYVRFDPTDLANYEKDDIEHVGWYWLPYEAGKPVWLPPYYNQNNNVLMISYVVPIYCEDVFVGVVGMDFRYATLTEKVDKIKIYDNGFAHLELDETIIYDGKNSTQEPLLQSDSKDFLRASGFLKNGMTLVLSASYDDIKQIRYDIIQKILFIVVISAILFSLIVIFMVKKIVKPLKELATAAAKLSNGDYNIKVAHSRIREINLLSTMFENMIVALHEQQKVQHLLSHRDPLTGLRNTTSYKSWVVDFDKKIKEEGVSFGVAVFDINYLKTMNDTHGHIFGNELISTVAKIVSDTFKRSPVFRIGGDEFCVILQNRDLEDMNRLFEVFDSECARTYIEIDKNNIKFPVSIAKGYAEFDHTKDTQFADVFERADCEMYANKRRMKEKND